MGKNPLWPQPRRLWHSLSLRGAAALAALAPLAALAALAAALEAGGDELGGALSGRLVGSGGLV